jgi:hypothetical protein
VAPWPVGASTPAGRYVVMPCADGGAALFQWNASRCAGQDENSILLLIGLIYISNNQSHARDNQPTSLISESDPIKNQKL